PAHTEIYTLSLHDALPILYMSPRSPSILSLPEALVAVLREQDGSTEDFDEADLSFVLERKLHESGKLTEEQRKASFAEIAALQIDRKSTRLNSSHSQISYA